MKQISKLAAIAAIALVAGAASAEPLRLRLAYVDTPTQLAPLRPVLAERHPEVFVHVGKTYVLEPFHFTGSPPQITALAAGELEIGALGPSSLALAITNAHLDMRVVGDIMQAGIPGYFDAYFAVKTDGPVKTIADMKGRRAAINALGSPVWMELHIALQKAGLGDKDYTVIEAQFPNMFAMIEADKVDIVPVISSKFSHDFDVTGRYRALFTTAQAVGPNQAGLWAMRADFIAAHRAVLVDYFEDSMRAVRWFLERKNHDEAIAIVQFVTKQPREAVDYAFTKGDVYRSPDLVPNVKAIQQEITEAAELKLLPEAIALAPRYIDLSMIAEAKVRLDH